MTDEDFVELHLPLTLFLSSLIIVTLVGLIIYGGLL